MYYSNIQLLINGKSRENVHSGQGAEAFETATVVFEI